MAVTINGTTGIETNTDTGKVKVGASDDLEMYHDGSYSKIKTGGSSHLFIQADYDTNQWLYLDAGHTIELRTTGYETAVKCNPNGSVDLYHNNTKKLETFGEGLVIHGGASSGEVKMYSNDGLRGYLYVNNSSNMGLLNNSGGWRFQVENDGDYIFYGSNVSDRDRKDNITTVTGTSLDKITKLVPKTYNWKATDDGKTPTDKIFTGFIAQEVNEHLPSLVTGTDGQKNMAIDYNGLLAHAVKAITELSAEVETLKTKVAALEAHTHE